MPRASSPKSRIKPKTWYRRERFSGEVSNKASIAAAEVLRSRSRRANLRSGIASVTTLAAGAIPAVKAISSSSLSHGALKAIALVVASAAAGGAVGALGGHAARSRAVRTATFNLKKILHDECKSYDRKDPFSNPLIAFLYRYKYAYVDKHGHLTGTNVPRIMGIGRMRIATSDVLPYVLVMARENSSKK